MDKETAIELAKSKWWERKSDLAVALMQLQEPRLCMPWDIFHCTVERVLKRPVYTHEFAQKDNLIKEIRGKRLPPETVDELLGQIPHDKTILLMMSSETLPAQIPGPKGEPIPKEMKVHELMREL